MAVKQKPTTETIQELQPDVDPAEAKRLKKAAKRAAREAAVAEEKEEAVETVETPEKAKKAKKANKPIVTEEDPLEAKKAKKAAKRAAAEIAETPAEPEENLVAAKKARKAARRAAENEAAQEEAAAMDSSKDGKAKDESETPKDESRKAEIVHDDDDFTVFVRGLPYSCEEPALRKDFDECGEILNLSMPVAEDGRCRGLAFVKYANKAGMEAAIKFNGEPYGGRYLEVKRATPNPDKGKGKGEKGKGKSEKGKGKGESHSSNSDLALFVGGLPYTATEEQVRAHFAECGEIASIRMPTFEDGSPKGIAFVRFTKEEDVEAGLNLNESDVEGRFITVRKAGDNPPKGKGKCKDGKGGKEKGEGKNGKDKGKDGKGKKGKGKKGGLSDEKMAARDGAIVAPAGTVKTFCDSDDE